MSRIDELIAELCPSGVPYRTLGELGQFERGRRFTKADVVEDGIPSIHYGEIYTHYGAAAAETVSHVRTDLATQLRFARHGDVVIAGVGETVEDVGKGVAWLGTEDAAIHDDCFLYRSSMNPKYVSYYLQTEAFHSQKRRHVARAKVKRLSAQGLASITIPVPPLEVQREIVRVLDAFAELEAELEARRRQYAHYRYSLVAFEGASGVEWMTLGDAASVRHGCEFPRSLQGRESGMYPFFKVSDMNRLGNEVELVTAGNYVDSQDLDSLGIGLVPVGTVLIPRVGAAVATNKKRLTVRPSVFDTSFLGLIPGPETHPRFLLHWMTTIDLSTLCNRGGALPSVRRALLEAMLFPRLALEEQMRIVAILDKFDALVNNLSSGLPAELAARRKQYEYYRAKLLTFKEWGCPALTDTFLTLPEPC